MIDNTFPLEINDECSFKIASFEPNSFIFSLDNKEVMKITTDGFYWKGKLVEEDREIYLKVKEFFNIAKQP